MMKIASQYSHLNGWEHITIHKPNIWNEILDVIAAVGNEKRRFGSNVQANHGEFRNPDFQLHEQFEDAFQLREWHKSQTVENVVPHSSQGRHRVDDDLVEQQRSPVLSYHQTGVIKDLIAVKLLVGKVSFSP